MRRLMADLLRVFIERLDPPAKASDKEEQQKTSVPIKPGEIRKLKEPTSVKSHRDRWPYHDSGMYL